MKSKRTWPPLLLAACGGWAASSVGFAAPNAPAGMVVLAGGVFRPLFGSPTDAREVPVPAFCLDALPVTNGDFLEFVRANPGWQRSSIKRLFADECYLKHWAGNVALGTNAPPGAPVAFVSWFAARAYAQWKGKRLPTIPEWELAAAASTTGPDGRNDLEFQRQLLAWYASPSGKLANVGGGQPNYWGAYDLHGLVWEWVSDFSTAMVTGDARADSELDRQLYCGSGAVGARDVTDYAAFMRYGFRSSLKADYCIHNLGFRCAKNL
jgi:formylglycine-generating enzyme required for sulfatase activity